MTFNQIFDGIVKTDVKKLNSRGTHAEAEGLFKGFAKEPIQSLGIWLVAKKPIHSLSISLGQYMW